MRKNCDGSHAVLDSSTRCGGPYWPTPNVLPLLNPTHCKLVQKSYN